MPLVLSGTNGVLDNSGAFVLGTSVASTSGTSIDFTSIPSWVKRITVIVDSVTQSTATSPALLFQIGTSGGVVSTGYVCTGSTNGNSNAPSTSGFPLRGSSGSNSVYTGTMTIVLVGSNTWVATGVFGDSTYSQSGASAGRLALGGTLDRVRIVANGGSFSAGTINILYE